MNHFKDKNEIKPAIQCFKIMRKKIKEKMKIAYVKCLDWFYELNLFSELQFFDFPFKRNCEEILDEFYKDLQTVDDEKLEGVFPSFKLMINNTTLNKPSEVTINFILVVNLLIP